MSLITANPKVVHTALLQLHPHFVQYGIAGVLSFVPFLVGTILNMMLFIFCRLRTSASFSIPLCPSKSQQSQSVHTAPCCDYTHPAHFYVMVGVLSFVYCLVGTIMYVVFDELCRTQENIPTVVSIRMHITISHSFVRQGVTHHIYALSMHTCS